MPGAILMDRYRVVSLSGKGGMGEVYRADDLKLGQPVALKFLPAALANDPARLDRFYAEVRISRQISHPNICRVHDIGEVNGHPFLSMEYIDGEDLASLLSRIGRLPPAKALEIARQLAAGLSAAHEKGVLHRDLKPANVMIDGRGHTHVADFGLAVSAEEGVSSGEIAGTPAYMAPEQLAGKQASTQSDLYALGLILFEMYTGRRAFEATSVAELSRKHASETPPNPSRLVEGLDPAVERVILKCLEKDARRRPASALEVLMSLPGGDPLQAAIAAGETPSPEMVAAAGSESGIGVKAAWTLLVVLLGALAAVVSLRDRTYLIRKIQLPKSADSLEERAQEIARSLGGKGRPRDEVSGFLLNAPSLARAKETRSWSLQPGPVLFSYRSSPQDLSVLNPSSQVSLEDPPMTLPGMLSLLLDPQGRLVELQCVPARRMDAGAPVGEVDWAPLLGHSGLDVGRLKPAPSRLAPPFHFDKSAAWEGIYPNQPNVPIRVEAASYRGRPVWFRVVAPWDPGDAGDGAPDAKGWERIATVAANLVWWFVQAGAAFLAFRNLRMGRGDRKRALGLGIFCCLLFALDGIVLTSHHVSDTDVEGQHMTWLTGLALYGGVMIWVGYLAVEPMVRRRWPHSLVSWNRLLQGKLRDPLVGRDVMVGGVAAVLYTLARQGASLAEGTLAFRTSGTLEKSIQALSGFRGFVSSLLVRLPESLVESVLLVCLLLVFRIVLRKQALAAIAFVAWGAVWSIAIGGDALMNVVSGVVALVLILRVGLLALLSFSWFCDSLALLPIDFGTWYSGRSLVVLAMLGAVAIWAFAISLAGRSAFGTLLEE